MSEITKVTVYECDVVRPWPKPGTYALVPLVEGALNAVRLVCTDDVGHVPVSQSNFDLRAKEDERQGERREGWPYLVSDYDRRKYKVRNPRKEDLGREARDE